MKKTILILIAVIVLGAAGGVYYLLTNLDSIVKAAIEKYGSAATQTAVRVDSVDIRLTEGTAAVSGLTVANPEGFAAPHAFTLGDISVTIDLDSLGRQPVVIDDISVGAPAVFYEMNSDNKDNINTLKRNLAGSEEKAARPDESAGGGPRLLIERIALEDIALHAEVVPLERSYDVELPALEMSRLGAPDGATPPELARQVMDELLGRVRNEIERQGIGRVRGRLDREKAELDAEADKELEEEKQQARERLEEMLER